MQLLRALHSSLCVHYNPLWQCCILKASETLVHHSGRLQSVDVSVTAPVVTLYIQAYTVLARLPSADRRLHMHVHHIEFKMYKHKFMNASHCKHNHCTFSHC